MLAGVLNELSPQLPARHLGWAFPDETTSAILLEGVGNLVLSYRPPQPVLFINRERLRGEPRNPFQRLLANRVRGDLLRVEQMQLDRVVLFHFAGASGFVDQPPVRILFEVTGRNANVLVLEEGEGFSGRIIQAAREITNNRNRFRTIRSGGEYTPPPPYQKLDPRDMTESDAQNLAKVPLIRWRSHIDGLGPLLVAELARRADLDLSEAANEHWPKAFESLQSLIIDPSVTEGLLSEGAKAAAKAEKVASLRKLLREPLEKRVKLLSNQVQDVERAEQGVETAAQERLEADLLMAYAHQIDEAGATKVNLPAFDGTGETEIELEPQLSVVKNAEKRYSRARRRDEVYMRLAEREDGLRSELEQAKERLAQLEQATLSELEALSADLQAAKPIKSQYGMRMVTPAGYEVLVGRNNKENAVLTHRVGRSGDFWFHAQGYPGSHVLVRTAGQDLDLPDILFAAQIAATHSKARGSGNVPVDYTRIKYIWRPKGAPAGQVHYTDQKTVFVDGVMPEVSA